MHLFCYNASYPPHLELIFGPQIFCAVDAFLRISGQCSERDSNHLWIEMQQFPLHYSIGQFLFDFEEVYGI